MNDLDEPLYEISRVAAAVDAKANSLRTWLQKGYWRLNKGDRAAEASGKAHLLTLRRSLQIGVAVRLIELGIEPSRAFRATWDFSDTASPLESSNYARDPGELFPPPALTLLVASKDAPTTSIVTPVDDNTPLNAVRFHPLTGGPLQAGTFIVVNYVDARIRRALEG